MHLNRRILGIVMLASISAMPHSVSAEEGGSPRFFLLNQDYLDIAKRNYEAEDPATVSDVRTLIRIADRKLGVGPFSVINSPVVAPSGDPHDIVKYASYSWPNPDTPDGLPWIARDGHNNPDSALGWGELVELGRAAEPLMLAYYFTGDERYAEKTASLMRTWFLDPETRMNPRDEWSGMSPGRNNGSFNTPGFGNLFATRNFIDNLGMLEASPHWSAEDKAGVQQWFRDLSTWADSHWKAAVQFREPSNHGTNYDFMFTVIGMYAEDEALSVRNYEHYVYERFPGQIDADGSNPYEMLRANNYLYHYYNLNRAIDLAVVGELFSDLDFFEYETDDGRSLRLALDYLIPYWTEEKSWDKWPGEAFEHDPHVYYQILRRAAIYFEDPTLLEVADHFNMSGVVGRYVNLMHPEDAVFERVWVGDVNLDGYFDAQDLTAVFQVGQYDDNVANNSTWVTGDWNRDGEFNSRDLVAAFIVGGFEAGLHPSKTPIAEVPEPSSFASIWPFIALCLLARRRPCIVALRSGA